MTELKPCPFCGGRASVRTFAFMKFCECENCLAGGTTFFDTEEEAIEAWNIRALPTCKMTESRDIGMETDLLYGWSCDNCGRLVWCDEVCNELPNYCPNCGAKVVS